jgi:hypothetical protein
MTTIDTDANTWKGAWSSATTYTVGQFVSFSGNTYISTIANNLNNTPTGGTGWVLFTSSSGFPIVIGATSLGASSTTTAITGLTLDGVTPTTFGFLDATSSIQNQLNLKAPLASPAFTGTATAVNLTVTGTCTGCGSSGSGFPITLGSTSIASSSTTTAITGLSVNGVTLNAAGSTTLFLNQAGGYTAPSGTVATIGINTANGVSGTSSGGANPLLTVVLGAITPTQVTTGFVTTTGNAACSGCGGGDTLTEGIAPSGSFIGAGLDTYWADSGSHHIAANLNNGGTSFIPVVPGSLTPGDVYVVGANGIDPVDGGVFPGTGISGGTAGFIPLFGSATTITASSHLDDGQTTAGVISSSEPIAIASASLPPGIIITPNGVAPAVQTGSLMWGVPASGFTAQTWLPPSTPCTGGLNVTNTSGIEQLSCGAAGTPAYPLTITGGVSGGVVYGSSATVLTVSPAGTVNTTMLWGGAGAAPTTGHMTDNGTVILSSIPIESSNGTATSAGLGLNGTAIGLSGVSGNMNLLTASVTRAEITASGIQLGGNEVGFGSAVTANDTGLSRVSAGVVGIGTGTAGSIAGTLEAASVLATGTVDGTAPTTITTGTTATLGGTFKSGYTWNQEATAATAVTYTLPTAAAGLQYCVGNSWNGTAATTGVLTVATSATGQFIIFTDGTLSATGGNVTSPGTAADMGCFVGVDATHWQFQQIRNTWVKH